ncbi:hypothetical protein Ocin01_05847 [Orchesella cincta]|uniref:Spaetzle domain-containing protein n=1 Tax=Orchesella cincta TaxID=48709 RepID=A0A1D2N6I9_ORCCI|nr:hypothetical protein Ocin01_05847 [Orchesella cincta]
MKSQNLRENWIDTLCGDLNTGLVPQNPMGHKFLDGGTYPFETIKNKTLEFFRRALPILKSDKSLPKVAKYAMGGNYLIQPPTEHLYRAKRGIATREAADPSPLLFDASYPDSFYYDDPVPSATSNRQRRQHSPSNPNGFCENRLGYYNRLCKLYNAMWGKTPHNIQRDASGEVRRHHGTSTPHQNHHHHQHHSNNHHQKKHFRQAFHTRPDVPVAVGTSGGSGGGGGDWAKTPKHLHTGAASNNNPSTAELPPTPCPSAAEYLTPVFARNHEGAWRYVVQIPKEGYFTQTVEVTKCLKSNCYYMEGSCKTSPRWQSLLVAEMFYPDTTFPTTPKTTTTTKATPLLSDGEAYPDYLYSKGSSASLENGGSSYSNELGLPFKKRSIRSLKDSKNSPPVCDGYDEVGCYQVRLFYDWFLIPGSCKCWKRQFDFTLKG